MSEHNSGSGGADLVRRLEPGIYRGTVEGIESGHCTARISVRVGPGGCRILDYEAVSDDHGLQHLEHALLSADALYVAFAESAGVTVFHGLGNGVFATAGVRPMEIRIAVRDGLLTYAWFWGTGTSDVVERSRAQCRRAEF